MDKIKSLRVKADRLIQIAQGFKSTPETTLAWRNLQQAKGWLGKMLGANGSPTPYTPANFAQDIPATTDVFDGIIEWPIDQSLLANVNFLRAEIKAYLEEFKKVLFYSGLYSSENEKTFKGQAYIHLEEASMNLGFALACIRESALALESFNKELTEKSALVEYQTFKTNGINEMKNVVSDSTDPNAEEAATFIPNSEVYDHATESIATPGVDATNFGGGDFSGAGASDSFSSSDNSSSSDSSGE